VEEACAVSTRPARRAWPASRTAAIALAAAFAARLKDAVDRDAVHADLASVVHRALEPAHVSLWTNDSL
jgi:hypothetical protein